METLAFILTGTITILAVYSLLGFDPFEEPRDRP